MTQFTITLTNENLSTDIIRDVITNRYNREKLGEWPKFYSDSSVVDAALTKQAAAIYEHLIDTEVTYNTDKEQAWDSDFNELVCNEETAIRCAINDADNFYCSDAWIDADCSECEIDYEYVANALDDDGENIQQLFKDLTEGEDYENCDNKPTDFIDFLKEIHAYI